jgi:hypothetical protein
MAEGCLIFLRRLFVLYWPKTLFCQRFVKRNNAYTHAVNFFRAQEINKL